MAVTRRLSSSEGGKAPGAGPACLEPTGTTTACTAVVCIWGVSHR
jgi:hypothetical protein